MKFGSVCSGIEAASVAWNPLGWEAAWLSEIEPFPSAVLKHHYPDVPNLGDMTALPDRILSGEVEAPDLFCGGTPCQAFSVAGLRNSLDDARGNLSLTFVGIANAIDHVRSVRGDSPAIIFWENVPGVLSTKDNAFGCFLGALAGEDDPIVPPGEKWTNAGCVYGPQRTVAWRVLDAQYFGVAQRRRRVFVVASARDDFNPTEVLFEFNGVRRNTAPSREKGERIAPCVTNGPPFSRTGNERVEAEAMVVGSYTPSSIGGYKEGVGTLRANGGDIGGGSENLVAARMVAFGEYSVDGTASTMKSRDWKDATDLVAQSSPIAAYAIQGSMIGRNDNAGPQGDGINEEVCFTQNTIDRHAVAQPIPFDTTQITSPSNYSKPQFGDPCHPLAAGAHPPAVAQPIAFSRNDDGRDATTNLSPTMRVAGRAGGMLGVAQPIAFEPGKLKRLGYGDAEPGLSPALRAQAGDNQLAVAFNIAPGKGALKDDIHVTDAHVSKTIDASGSNPAMHQGGAAIVQPIGVDMFNAAFSGEVAVPLTNRSDGTGTGPTVMTPVSFQETADCLTAAYGTKWNGNASATNGSLFAAQPIGWSEELTASIDLASTIQRGGDGGRHDGVMQTNMAVRRLTPIECERLQGFPDNYTEIPWRKKPADQCPDGPRYKALGNSWAVPVVHWIGKRIQAQLEK